MKKPLLILTGPTAVGKTSASLRLAKAANGEIISADSMQIYQHMDIGTAKIKPQEMEGVPHYLVDEQKPDTPFDVYRFQQKARDAMNRIWAKEKLPIVVGGTGFYIQALLYDIDFCAETEENHGYRDKLERFAEEQGNLSLHEKLKEVDPVSAESIHPNNRKRVIRALEYHHTTGERISDHNAVQRKKESPYNFLYVVLTMDRARLYEQIDRRVELMFEQGLCGEVKQLIDMGCRPDMVSMQAIGYKEWFPYWEGKISLDEVKEQIKKDTRHFAKRQLTWFRRERDVVFLNKEQFQTTDELVKEILCMAKERGITES